MENVAGYRFEVAGGVSPVSNRWDAGFTVRNPALLAVMVLVLTTVRLGHSSYLTIDLTW